MGRVKPKTDVFGVIKISPDVKDTSETRHYFPIFDNKESMATQRLRRLKRRVNLEIDGLSSGDFQQLP